MKVLQDSIEIRAMPEKIFDWLLHLEEHYREWHPDHITCSWVKGGPGKEGSVLYIEEYVHKDLHKMEFRITKIEPARKIEYSILFPTSILCPNGSFIIELKNRSCIFTATLSFRFGGLLSHLFKKRVEALRTHMKEEGENLKKLLEKSKDED